MRGGINISKAHLWTHKRQEKSSSSNHDRESSVKSFSFFEAKSLLIAESTEEGILLRPAVALPVEVYSRDRLGEFATAEQDLAKWYSGESR